MKGILLGAALFFMPFFILKVILFFFITGALLRFFIFRKFRRTFGPWFNPAFVDRIRNMSDNDFQRFKQKHYRPHYDYYNRPKGPVINIDIK